MAERFNPQKFDINSINGGNKYQNGDGLSAETINKVVEAAAYMQENGGGTQLYKHTITLTTTYNGTSADLTAVCLSSRSSNYTSVDEIVADGVGSCAVGIYFAYGRGAPNISLGLGGGAYSGDLFVYSFESGFPVVTSCIVKSDRVTLI